MDRLLKIDAAGSAQRKYRSGTSENMFAVEELVLSQEDAPAPESHGTVCHFWNKNDIIVNPTFPYRKLMFFDTSFNYLYFRNRAANFVEICNIYANQLVIK